MVRAHVPPGGLPKLRQRRLRGVSGVGHRAGALLVRPGIVNDQGSVGGRRRRSHRRHRGERGGAVHRAGHVRHGRRARVHARKGPPPRRGGEAVAALRRPRQQRGHGDGVSRAARERSRVVSRVGVRGKRGEEPVRVRRGGDARGADPTLRAGAERRGHRREGGVPGDRRHPRRHDARRGGDDDDGWENRVAVGGVRRAHRRARVLQRSCGEEPGDRLA
mmetsp:Transcript_826/g.3424  ORF Transcript_826/g.3424 Transcript_826/m.3424 type:complete len:219 (-) Transcript_826:557-1213(-)